MSHQCTNARNSLENRHFLQLLGTLGAPSSRNSRLSMSLQQHEIGLEACPTRRPRYPVAGVPENCNLECGLWKPNTSSFRGGDQGECTMEKEVRRHQKINVALAIAGASRSPRGRNKMGCPSARRSTGQRTRKSAARAPRVGAGLSPCP